MEIDLSVPEKKIFDQFLHIEVCGGHLGHVLPYMGMVAIFVM